MLNSSDILRGYTETIMLSQLNHGDSYGYAISKAVSDITGGEIEFKEGTLYTAFRRLEQSGLIQSYWGDEQAGARRRYYHLTEKGRDFLLQNLEDWRHYSALLEKLLGQED